MCSIREQLGRTESWVYVNVSPPFPFRHHLFHLLPHFLSRRRSSGLTLCLLTHFKQVVIVMNFEQQAVPFLALSPLLSPPLSIINPQVDEAGMPKGKWRKLPPRRRMG
ncbi:unnamed protein product [Closterium sp. NIES-65]|nr:unnamed protein product [Closterium sp. NIES-65]